MLGSHAEHSVGHPLAVFPFGFSKGRLCKGKALITRGGVSSTAVVDLTAVFVLELAP